MNAFLYHMLFFYISSCYVNFSTFYLVFDFPYCYVFQSSVMFFFPLFPPRHLLKLVLVSFMFRFWYFFSFHYFPYRYLFRSRSVFIFSLFSPRYSVRCSRRQMRRLRVCDSVYSVLTMAGASAGGKKEEKKSLLTPSVFLLICHKSSAGEKKYRKSVVTR